MEHNSKSQDQKANTKKPHYSEKKNKRTVKDQTIVNLNVEIIHKPLHSLCRKNDYAVLKTKHPVLSKELMIFYDLGYFGVERDFPEQISILPYKKRKGKQLTSSQKNRIQFNIPSELKYSI